MKVSRGGLKMIRGNPQTRQALSVRELARGGAPAGDFGNIYVPRRGNLAVTFARGAGRTVATDAAPETIGAFLRFENLDHCIS